MQLDFPITLHNSKLAITLYDLYHALLKAWIYAWPLAFPGGVAIIRYCADDMGLINRLRIWYHQLCDFTRRKHYNTYRNATEEAEYWRSSESLRRALRASDANTMPAEVPLVRYYAPRLLPAYRESAVDDPEAMEFYLAPKAYCKWHRMVFRAPMHPTLKEAEEQIRHYSSRDRREIHRISRLLSDGDVFRKKVPWSTRYATMWKKWLDTKGPDVAIVFE